MSARPFVRTGIKPPYRRITQNSTNVCASGAYFAVRQTRPIRYPVSLNNPPNLSIFFRTGHPAIPATDVKNQTDLRRVPPSRSSRIVVVLVESSLIGRGERRNGRTICGPQRCHPLEFLLSSSAHNRSHSLVSW